VSIQTNTNTNLARYNRINFCKWLIVSSASVWQHINTSNRIRIYAFFGFLNMYVCITLGNIVSFKQTQFYFVKLWRELNLQDLL